MARLRRGTQTALSEAASLRVRAAWLYYKHGLTQQDVASKLGVSRTTVIRLLDEALRRGEVRVWIEEGESKCMELAVELERELSLDEAIIVPEAPDATQIANAVGSALGKFLSDVISDNMTIGVGWGRTLTASLASFRPPGRSGVKVVSLLGSTIETDVTNPVEYSWRFASQLDAACYLFPAPLVVDSVETKRRLIEKCGLNRLHKLARNLDLAVVGVGGVGPKATSLSSQMISKAELSELLALGCIGDVLGKFFDKSGHIIDHPVNHRVMSVELDTLSTAKHLVIASGGAHRAQAILATIERVGCNTLVSDEGAARIILSLLKKRPAAGAK